VILSHPIAAMSLGFLPLTVQLQVFPERFVYIPESVMFPVMLCLCIAFI
jgi:hypothetical protein